MLSIQKNIHSDHLIPLGSFNLTQPNEQLEAIRLRNARIIDATTNLEKVSRYPTEDELVTQ